MKVDDNSFQKHSKTDFPHASIVLIHGMGDHSRALPYKFFTDYFVTENFEVYTFDLPGHGINMGQLSSKFSWDELTEYCHTKVIHICSQTKEPMFIAGLSLGGLLAMNYALMHPENIRGVVAVSPALDACGSPSLVRHLVKWLARYVPKIKINPKLNLCYISRDKEAVEVYTRDPYWQESFPIVFANAVLEGIKEFNENAHFVQSPLLMQQGIADKIVPNEAGVNVFHKTASIDKSLIRYPDLYHNLFLETEKYRVFQDIQTWINKYIDNS